MGLITFSARSPSLSSHFCWEIEEIQRKTPWRKRFLRHNKTGPRRSKLGLPWACAVVSGLVGNCAQDSGYKIMVVLGNSFCADSISGPARECKAFSQRFRDNLTGNIRSTTMYQIYYISTSSKVLLCAFFRFFSLHQITLFYEERLWYNYFAKADCKSILSTGHGGITMKILFILLTAACLIL